MQLVSKYCALELEEYGKCVQSNPSDWHLKCKEHKTSVSECSSSHPVVQKIKSDCGKEYGVYDKCLRANTNQVEECIPALETFMQCAENASEHLKKSWNSTQDLKKKQNTSATKV
ncbi:coiled-coil-helix-coiled-coil-helix domain-containing protein 5-like [Saccoglossus kowalevskii]|uniref:Coiled-coil-helix-coiled-coil-helix domain-containing protein 5-like n=1 Tax=Saccoglossus kowalevskii TaxID=10224 RepID=A0ABM0GME9_SACKO|nr:PREDICTED: coiled-coil-helix-coiled-coil-helix domain-containing protein 5-like [Saccoglossus kowalevskii]